MNSHPRMPAGHGFPHQGVHLKDWKAESPPPIQPSQLWPKFPAGQHDFQPILAHFRTSKGKKPSCPSARQTGNKTRRWGRLWCWLAGSPGWCPLRHKRRLATRHGAWGWDTSGSRMPSDPPCPPLRQVQFLTRTIARKCLDKKIFMRPRVLGSWPWMGDNNSLVRPTHKRHTPCKLGGSSFHATNPNKKGIGLFDRLQALHQACA